MILSPFHFPALRDDNVILVLIVLGDVVSYVQRIVFNHNSDITGDLASDLPISCTHLALLILVPVPLFRLSISYFLSCSFPNSVF